MISMKFSKSVKINPNRKSKIRQVNVLLLIHSNPQPQTNESTSVLFLDASSTFRIHSANSRKTSSLKVGPCIQSLAINSNGETCCDQWDRPDASQFEPAVSKLASCYVRKNPLNVYWYNTNLIIISVKIN